VSRAFGWLREGHAFGVKNTHRIDFSQGEKPNFSGKYRLAQAMQSQILLNH
jgi:hypothetical protein